MRVSDAPEGPLVLDTGAFSLIVWGRAGHEAYSAIADGHLFVLPFAVVGELRAGAIIAQWGQRRRDELEERIRRCVVMPSSNAVTQIWAELHARYRDQLGTSGGNDMWIAAAALAHDPPLPVLTTNPKDFEKLANDHSLVVVHPDG